MSINISRLTDDVYYLEKDYLHAISLSTHREGNPHRFGDKASDSWFFLGSFLDNLYSRGNLITLIVKKKELTQNEVYQLICDNLYRIEGLYLDKLYNTLSGVEKKVLNFNSISFEQRCEVLKGIIPINYQSDRNFNDLVLSLKFAHEPYLLDKHIDSKKWRKNEY